MHAASGRQRRALTAPKRAITNRAEPEQHEGLTYLGRRRQGKERCGVAGPTGTATSWLGLGPHCRAWVFNYYKL